MSPNVILAGDFNIHLDNPTDSLAKDFISTLDSFNLTQFINFPTHNKGHILDLVCCTGVTPCNLSAVELPISDHKFVLFDSSSVKIGSEMLSITPLPPLLLTW